MKYIVIIYSVSLLILLFLFLVNHKKSKSFHLKTDDSWYITLLAILLLIVGAPLIVLWYPFSSFRTSKQDKERDKRNEEWDKKQAEEQHKRDLAYKRYNDALESKKDECDDEFIIIAQQLLSIVKEHDYRSIPLILDRVYIPDHSSLMVEECKQDGMGDESKLYIANMLGNKNYNIFEELRFERTCMGAWQAFLLHKIEHYLPLWWHANYGYREYIYSNNNLSDIHDTPYEKGQKYPDFSSFDLNPTVRRSGNHYFISCVFWSDFGGLIREYCELIMDDGQISEFIDFKEDVLYEYECGIRF